MNKKTLLPFLGIAVIVAALIFGAPQIIKKDASSDSQNLQEVRTPQTLNVNLTVEGLFQNKPVTIAENSSLLDLLNSLNRSNPEIKLVTKEYSGMGTLVVGMGNLSNGTTDEYWQYKVNGVMPQVGADQYKLKNGDSVDWYFGKSTQ